jgi:hypothetical protein
LLNEGKDSPLKKYRADHRPKLYDAEVLGSARQLPEKHFPFATRGYCCIHMTLYQILIGVAAAHSPIDAGIKQVSRL